MFHQLLPFIFFPLSPAAHNVSRFRVGLGAEYSPLCVHGKKSMVGWLDPFGDNFVKVSNGFSEPRSSLSRASFGKNLY